MYSGRVERKGAAFGQQRTLYKTIQISRTIHGKMERPQVELITECLIPADGGRNSTSERRPKENRRRPTRLRPRSLTAAGLQITDIFIVSDGNIGQSKQRKKGGPNF
jgi:hypothetical protein